MPNPMTNNPLKSRSGSQNQSQNHKKKNPTGKPPHQHQHQHQDQHRTARKNANQPWNDEWTPLFLSRVGRAKNKGGMGWDGIRSVYLRMHASPLSRVLCICGYVCADARGNLTAREVFNLNEACALVRTEKHCLRWGLLFSLLLERVSWWHGRASSWVDQ